MKKKLLLGSLLFTIVVGNTSALLQPKHALGANAANWQAGRIIDDAVFTDANSMSVSQIQDFLNQKVGTGGYGRVSGQCDTNGQATSEYGGGTRADYGAAHGNPSPFTCLKDFYEVPKTSPGPGIPANNYGGKPIPAGAKSAAQIISDAAHQYNISPKVLLVTIQKESSGPLTTDDWPFLKQYTYAMGSHCPDGPNGANCNTDYAGFSMQIYDSASLLRYYLDNMQQSWWPYKKPYQTNNILWNTTYTNCGGADVYIQNKATAALYTYTPYQPNQAALNNLYGTGDSCSAYGNRNFWRIFTDWFGTTYSPYFTAQYRAQSSDPTIMTGDSTTVYVQFINTSNTFWKDDVSAFSGYPPIHLAATNPINRTSTLRSASWLSGSRPNGTFTKVIEPDGWNLSADQHTVQPGQIAEFQFKLSVPLDYAPGQYREYFQPVPEGSVSYNMGAWAYFDVNVVKSVYKATFHSQSNYPTLVVGDSKKVYFQYSNDGNVPWYDDTLTASKGKQPVHLATTWPINRTSKFADSWPAPNRPNLNFSAVYEADGTTLASNQHTVQPGQIARFEFNLRAGFDQQLGTSREYFQPVLEGAPNWDMSGYSYLDVTTEAQRFRATYSTQSPYPTIQRGQAKQIFIQYKNTGNVFWKDDVSSFPGFYPVHLAATSPMNRTSRFSSPSWVNPSRPAGTFNGVYEADGITPASDLHTVQPGQIARFQYELSVPATTPVGTYREYFQPVLEGSPSWDIGGWGYVDVNVTL